MGAVVECDRSQISIEHARQVTWIGPTEQACFLARMAMNDRERWSGRHIAHDVKGSTLELVAF